MQVKRQDRGVEIAEEITKGQVPEARRDTSHLRKDPLKPKT